jgi:hypothetical protein
MLRMRIYHNPAGNVILSGAKNLWNNSQMSELEEKLAEEAKEYLERA